MGATSSIDYTSPPITVAPYPSPPTSSTPIHLLPPELLTRILKLAGDSLTSATARHSLFKSCSLVSRAWRDCAQKEVFRQISFKGSVNLGRFLKLLRGTAGIGGWVLELSVGRPSWDLWMRSAESDGPLLDELAHHCDNVRRLQLAGVDRLPLFEVAAGSALRSLSLEECTILKPPGPYPAPTVEHLSLTACAILGLKSPNHHPPLGYLPSVRALSVTGKLKPTNKGPLLYPGASRLSVHPLEAIPTDLCSKLASCFGERLKCLSVDHHHLPDFLTSLGEGIKLRLFNLDVDSTPSSAEVDWGWLVSEIISLLGARSSPPPILRLPADISVFEALLSHLIQPPPFLNHLRILSHYPSGPSPDLSLYGSTACKELEEECKNIGIRLVLEEGANSSGDPFVVEGFWSFVRRVEKGEFGLDEGGVGGTCETRVDSWSTSSLELV